MPLFQQWLLLHTLAGMTIGALEAGGFQFMATLVLSGLFIGVAQWAVLRQVLRKSTCWIWISAIGWLCGIQIMIWLSGWLDPIVARFTLLGGGEVFWLNVVKQPIVLISMGTAQSLLLRSQRRNGFASIQARAAQLLNLQWIETRWIAISGVAGAIQGGSSVLACAVLCPAFKGQVETILVTAIAYGLGWFGYAVITANLLSKSLFLSYSEH